MTNTGMRENFYVVNGTLSEEAPEELQFIPVVSGTIRLGDYLDAVINRFWYVVLGFAIATVMYVMI